MNCQPVALQIKSLHNQIRRLLERTSIDENHANLTGMQYALLGFLTDRCQQGAVYQKDIETEFNIRRSTASEMVRYLEKTGYITRVSDAEDARLKRIEITPKAKVLNITALEHINRIEALLTKGITKEELDLFYAVLNKISQNANN